MLKWTLANYNELQRTSFWGPRDEWDRLVAPAAGSANQSEYVDQRGAGGSLGSLGLMF